MSKLMNLDAEQARYGLSDEKVAEKIGLSRVLYVARKNCRTEFKRTEINKLIALFGAKYEYLFISTDDAQGNAS